ncbi:hypothetical protein GCM10009678_48580 [Actinomadura kijaniata]|uniref:Ig-like domain-containing protein n=1 Tax=Actinomadura namibiensis TaxID=182080 RepID=A0A7W3LWB4_ACTNM|nr:hypothetical protein [Actinomadura namibiensis]MBA8955493.1 hypothetical protein [Actinomadura namibiensis]
MSNVKARVAGAVVAGGMALALAPAAPALATPSAAPVAAKTAAVEAGGSVSAKGSSSIKCGAGYGGNAKVNFSWSRGTSTTKIYFNNHCKKGKKITATVVQRRAEVSASGKTYKYWCRKFDTNGKTKGNKKFGTDYYYVWKVVRGHTVKNLPYKGSRKTSCKAR